MKLILLFLTLFSFSLCSFPAQETIARDWSKKYIYSHALFIPEADLDVITQLVYLSYWRSKITLDVQEVALSFVDSAWKNWENIIFTRLNPSNTIPNHSIPTCNSKKTLTAGKQHTHICDTYAQYLEQCMHGAALQSFTAHSAIQAMRAQSQKIVSSALLNIQKHIKSVLDTLKISKKNSSSRKGLRIQDYLWAYLPKLAVSTFIEADTLTNTLSRDSWLVLKQVQELSNYSWSTIETARSQFYADLFDELVVIYAILEIPLPTPLLSQSFTLQ